MRTIHATRYVTPLREGGSLPAIIEGDDLGTYVLKFRGAGQGPKVLVAELIAGEIGHALELPVPDTVLVELDPVLGRSEPDPEIQDLVQSSAGLNFGMDFLPGSISFDPALTPPPDAALASEIVWFDAYLTNVDRTARNTNMLVWHRSLWLIDHGSALVFHHGRSDFLDRSRDPFPQVRDHVLLPFASDLGAAGERLAARLARSTLEQIAAQIPDGWLQDSLSDAGPDERRRDYVAYLADRLEHRQIFLDEALNARSQFV